TKLTSAALAYGVAGLLLIGVFIWWEGRAEEPIIPLGLFRNRIFTVANILSFITGGVMFGALIFLPQYLQIVRHVSPTQSGFRLLPMLAGMLILSISTGRLLSRTGRYKKFVNLGTGVLAVATGMLGTITINTNAWAFSGMIFLIGAG